MIALLIVGAIIGLIGWIMLIVAAFRSGVLWGLAVLVGPILVSLLVPDLWISGIVGIAIILAFVVPHWEQTRLAFILYVVGSIMVIPPLIPRGQWDDQPTYAGNCERTPARTACAEFNDGYVWLVSDRITGWEERKDGVYPVQVALGKKGRYEHLLYTNGIMFVPNEGESQESEEAGLAWLEDRDDAVRLEFEADLEEPPAVPSLGERRVSTSAPEPAPSLPNVEKVHVLNRTKTYFPLDCAERPAKTYMMAKSMAIRQGYKLDPSCSH